MACLHFASFHIIFLPCQILHHPFVRFYNMSFLCQISQHLLATPDPTTSVRFARFHTSLCVATSNYISLLCQTPQHPFLLPVSTTCYLLCQISQHVVVMPVFTPSLGFARSHNMSLPCQISLDLFAYQIHSICLLCQLPQRLFDLRSQIQLKYISGPSYARHTPLPNQLAIQGLIYI